MKQDKTTKQEEEDMNSNENKPDNKGHYLIGPDYYDTYLWFVKVVLLCTIIPVVFISLIDGISEGISGIDGNYIGGTVRIFVSVFVNLLVDGLTSAAGTFGAVTLIFAILERRNVKIDIKGVTDRNIGGQEASALNTMSAPAVVSKKARIGRSDSICGIAFTVIFCMLLIFAPHFLSAVFRENGTFASVPIFNLDKWALILPVFLTGLLIGLANDILRLVTGRYCRTVMISSIVSGVIQLILSVVALTVLPLWNPDFAPQMLTHLDDPPAGTVKIFENWDWNMVSGGVLFFFIVVIMLSIGTTVYKTLRYGTAHTETE